MKPWPDTDDARARLASLLADKPEHLEGRAKSLGEPMASVYRAWADLDRKRLAQLLDGLAVPVRESELQVIGHPVENFGPGEWMVMQPDGTVEPMPDDEED